MLRDIRLYVAPRLHTSEPEFRFPILQELLFLGFELRRVNNHAGIMNARLMLYVEHLVKHHVVRGIAWNVRRVEYTADEDRVVSRVESAKHVA